MSKAVSRVPGGLHRQSRFFAATAGLWRRLGKLETSVLEDDMEEVTVDRPVYVTSLPRSGTTIVTELLERHPDLTSHRYSDFPNVWTPYWRNYLLQKTRAETPALKERAHADRIRVSNDSPEAVEEVLWMHFFPGVHDEAVSNVLDGTEPNPAFDSFYRDHVRKLLAVRRAKRYLAKGNYNIARIRYILSLFGDARFVIPVRDPLHHVASLVKQQRLFAKQAGEDARVPLQLALSGHFEFGPERVAVNLGDDDAVRAIRQAWDSGREAEGWARHWAMTYRFLLDELRGHEPARKACLLFTYDALCADSGTVIDRILDHCGLPADPFTGVRAEYVEKLSPPDYYQPDFDSGERAFIRDHCEPVYEELRDYAQQAV